jgi:hypothetical protein
VGERDERQLQRAGVLLAVASALLPPAAAARLTHEYTEDFTTKTYCDDVNTTALWDTTAAEVRLHPFAVARAGSCAMYDGPAVDLVLAGDYAYVAVSTGRGNDLGVVDISDPTNPTYVAECGLTYYPQGMDIAGNRVFVANDYLDIINISDPLDPWPYDPCYDVEDARDVAVAGNYAYVASGTNGFAVVDISDTAAFFVQDCGVASVGLAVAVAGDWAFVADADSGLTTIHIETPASPSVMGRCDTPGMAYDVAIAGNYAYVADGPSGLQVIDISEPGNPLPAGSYDTPGSAEGVTIAGDFAYVAGGGSGLRVVDISDPTFPYEPGYGCSGLGRRPRNHDRR